MQKGKSKDEGNKKTKHAKFSEKTIISYPLIPTRTYVCVCFEIRPFALSVTLFSNTVHTTASLF